MKKNDYERAKREAKIRYDDLCNALMNQDYVDFAKGLYPDFEASPARMLTANTVDFMLYIAKADGEISEAETTLIGDITGWHTTREFLIEFSSKNHIFEKGGNPALITMLVCNIENVWAKVDGNDRGIVRLLVKFFNLVADLTLYRNGKVNRHAKKNAKEYLKVNFDYIRKNVKCPLNDDVI